MRTITITMDEDEYRELWCYALHRHIGGRHPAAAFAKEAIFGYMGKTPIPDVKRAKLEEKYQIAHSDAMAAQLDGKNAVPPFAPGDTIPEDPAQIILFQEEAHG